MKKLILFLRFLGTFNPPVGEKLTEWQRFTGMVYKHRISIKTAWELAGIIK